MKKPDQDLADALCVIGALCDQVALHPPPSFVWASKRWKDAEPKMARLLKKYPRGLKPRKRKS
jgi:hypothetical protein